ncbi:MAG: GGDEF domain-containing protein [Pseudomonadota bacterium]|nr:GGDEF domain-containing protein [Pseudomonadota bacterium]
MSDDTPTLFRCPPDQKAFAKVYEYGDQASRLIMRHGTPPLPNTYALMYAYVARSDEKVVVAVDEMLERGALCQYEIDEVYNLHLRPAEEDHKREIINREVEEQLSSLLDLVGSSVENSDQFENALQQIAHGLTESASSSHLSSALARLLSENRRMTDQSRRLQDGLRESKTQIERLQQELEMVRNESLRDPLTAAYNRRAFDLRLDAELEAAQKNGTQLCLAIADLDHFKRVNDTFGHRVGDEVLKVFATVISNNIKGQDLAARYGGEEFAIILPATDLPAATRLIDRIRERMHERRLVLKNSKKPLGAISASFGIAQYVPGMSAADLIERADQRLYLAKAQGRNRVKADDTASDAA